MVLCACACSVTSIVSDCVTPWTVALQPPLSMGFSRQEFWSGFHVLLQGIFLTQGSNLHLPSPALQVNSLQLSHRGSPEMALYNLLNVYVCVCVCVCVCAVLCYLLFSPTWQLFLVCLCLPGQSQGLCSWGTSICGVFSFYWELFCLFELNDFVFLTLSVFRQYWGFGFA